MKLLKNRTFLFSIAIVILAVQRILNLNNLLEEPYSWRQGDTLFYAYDFFKNGINLFKPSVCWLGEYKTLILEFPLISAFMTLLFYVFGLKIIVAKIAALIVFSLSSLYFYKTVTYLYYPRLAKFALLVYLMLPLSLFFSVAVHIDFGAIFFTMVTIYYFLRGLKETRLLFLFISCFSGVIAFLIKSPYVFYAYLPLLYYALIYKKNRYFIISLSTFVIPVIIFYFWQLYVIRINSKAPDWFFIPDYFKFTDMSGWYFGNIEQRFDIENWKTLFDRFYESLTGYLGFPLFIAGFFLKLKKGYNKNFFYLYSIGLIIYLLIFFNLNVIHKYYQIPLLIMSSFFIAVSLDCIYAKLKEKSQNKSTIITSAIIFVLMVNCIWYAQRWYYKVDYVRKEVADIISDNTNQSDLIISVINITDPRDPRILSQSFRKGWSIDISKLENRFIDSLKIYRANYLAIASNEGLKDSLQNYLKNYDKKTFALNEKNWILYLYNLK